MLDLHLEELLLGELWQLEPRLGLKVQRAGVDHEPLEERRWAVLEGDAQVRVAVGADDARRGLLVLQSRILEGARVLGAGQAVLLEVDGVNDIVPERRVARLVLVFVITVEQSLAAAAAMVHADVLHPP